MGVDILDGENCVFEALQQMRRCFHILRIRLSLDLLNMKIYCVNLKVMQQFFIENWMEIEHATIGFTQKWFDVQIKF